MRSIRICSNVLLVSLLINCLGCDSEKTIGKAGEPTKADTLFSLLDNTGVEFTNKLTFNGEFNILEYLYYYNGGGVAIADVNNDGLQDIFFTGNEVSNRLYLNKGGMQFEDVTEKTGLKTEGIWSTGATFVDINHDGWVDLYVCNLGNYKIYEAKNHLYINQKDGTFREQAAVYGLDFSGLSTHSAFFDYDRDGDLDMYLLNHSFHDINSYTSADKRNIRDEIAGDKLYENLSDQGEVRFRDITEQAGIYSSHLGYGLGIGIADLNHDHWPDIYVSNDFHENDYLYISQKDGTFRETATQSFGHQTRFSMGNDIADINLDGFPDILTLDMMPYDHEVLMKSGGEDRNKVSQIKKQQGYHDQYSRNALQINKGNGEFVDMSLIRNVYATDWSWSPLIHDYDNDGLVDFYIANGIYKRPNDLDFVNFKSDVDFRKYKKSGMDSIQQRIIETMPSGHTPNIIYWGNTAGEFIKNELGGPSFSNGAAYGDLDNDGDLDLVNNQVNEQATIYENKTTNNFIKLSFNGPKMNPLGIGAKAILHHSNKIQAKEMYLSRGFQSAVSPELIFGMGKAEAADSLEVFFNGYRKVVRDLRANESTTVELDIKDMMKIEGIGLEKNAAPPVFPSVSFQHQEDRFYDYEMETLIPFSLSKRGPALTVGDFNNDKLQDFYIGGAHGQPGSLYVQMASGKGFEAMNQPVLIRDRAYEDTDAVFADIDNDGDEDLIVVSGGSRYQENDLKMKHRLYINQDGILERDPAFNAFGSNGSCVRICDYDNDGDIDIFIGSLSVPMRYGVSPASYLLENLGNGKMKRKNIPGMKGMITDAIWTDFDQDGDHDLLVTGLWMKPVWVENKKGILKVNEDHFPDELSGWWNSIAVGDINKDQRPDLLLGSFGLNGTLKASPDKPISLYLEDFDQNGRLDPVIFRYYNNREIPLFPKDELSEQLPYLKKNFQQYEKYSKITSPEELLGREVQPAKQVNGLASVVVLNLEDSLVISKLPLEAQLSAINDLIVADIDEDGYEEILLVGNYETQVAQYGNLDANAGSLLKINE
ncbi:MAG: VCBS repeat-containing protein, partial [Cyclobacteriaceae bacterium]